MPPAELIFLATSSTNLARRSSVARSAGRFLLSNSNLSWGSSGISDPPLLSARVSGGDFIRASLGSGGRSEVRRAAAPVVRARALRGSGSRGLLHVEPPERSLGVEPAAADLGRRRAGQGR